MILFYVQHLLGIGHLRRTLAIAEACQKAGTPVAVITGGMPVNLQQASPFPVYQLEPLQSADLSFSKIVDRRGGPLNDVLETARAKELLRLFHDLRPKVLVTELFPFGRRRFRFELLPLLEAARTAKTPVLCSVRDSVQKRSKAREAETIGWLRDYYQRVLVHGEKEFVPLSDSFAEFDEIADLVSYTGFVDTTPFPSPRGESSLRRPQEVLVSAGGGKAGERLYLAAAEASALSVHPDIVWRILAGTSPDTDLVSRLRQLGAETLTVESNRADFRDLLSGCRLSVSQAGYNSVVDILSSGAPALLVPFTGEGGETEQSARAQHLLKIQRAQVLPEADLDGPALAAATDRLLAQPRASFTPVACNGAERSAKALNAYLSS